MAIPIIPKSFKLRLPRRLRSMSKSSPPSTPRSDQGSSPSHKAATTKEDEFRQVFKFLDRNNDGRISTEELRNYFTCVGESVTSEEAEKIIREFAKGKGEEGEDLLLGYGEFVRMLEVRDGMEEDDDKVLRKAFEVYEEEKGCGCITPKGLQGVLQRLGDAKSHQECEAIIRVFDLDGNGVLDFHEFQMMMTTN